jgi:hypothetical protein
MVVEAEQRRQANENGKDNAGSLAMMASQIAPLMVKQRARRLLKRQTDEALPVAGRPARTVCRERKKPACCNSTAQQFPASF